MSARTLTRAGRALQAALRRLSADDATDVTWSSAGSRLTTPCIIWPEDSNESRARQTTDAGVTSRWQCWFAHPELGLPPPDAACTYADMSLRLLRITPYPGSIQIGELVART